MEVAVCKYRDRVIGFLIGDRYLKHEVPLGKNGRRIRRNWPDGYQIEKPNGHVVLKVKTGSMETKHV